MLERGRTAVHFSRKGPIAHLSGAPIALCADVRELLTDVAGGELDGARADGGAHARRQGVAGRELAESEATVALRAARATSLI